MEKTTSYNPESDSEDELPPGWEEKATKDGSVYFTDRHSKATQWTHPRTGRVKRVAGELPMGWERRETTAGEATFYNTHTNQTTRVDPRLAFAVEEPTLDIGQIRQRFDASSTAMQILHGRDLQGQLAVITGANTGIGLETARSLLHHRCRVVFACRSESATRAAIERLIQERPAVEELCTFVPLDLASFRSVREFVKHVRQTIPRIDFLILNAGVFALPFTQTEDGIETTFQVSHLSHFYLTLQLESLFTFTTRIVVLSSESHRYSSLYSDSVTATDLSPPNHKYWSMLAYNNAKLCNVLFALELADRWRSRGISVFAVHPGNMVCSQLSRNWWPYRLLFALVSPFTKSLQQAAATTVYCATAPELTGHSGYYFNNCYFCNPSKQARNAHLRKSLWTISEHMVESILENSAL